MKSKTSAADATPDGQRAPSASPVRFSLDYLIVIAGFGLCRAWIVFSLSASVSSFEARADWVFLVAGAVAAALARPFWQKRSAESFGTTRSTTISPFAVLQASADRAS